MNSMKKLLLLLLVLPLWTGCYKSILPKADEFVHTGCDVSVKGDVINYRVYEKDGPTADCMCRVEEMSSVVTGLKEGKEYTFNYSCSIGTGIESFTFVFKKGLHLIRDEEPYRF